MLSEMDPLVPRVVRGLLADQGRRLRLKDRSGTGGKLRSYGKAPCHSCSDANSYGASLVWEAHKGNSR